MSKRSKDDISSQLHAYRRLCTGTFSPDRFKEMRTNLTRYVEALAEIDQEQKLLSKISNK